MISRRNDIMRVNILSGQAIELAIGNPSSFCAEFSLKRRVILALAALFIFSVTQVTFGAILPQFSFLTPKTAYAASVQAVHPSGPEASVRTDAITVAFGQAMDTNQSLLATNVYINGSPGVSLDLAAADWSSDGLVLTLPIAGNLEWDTAYSVHVSRLLSELGTPLLGGPAFMFMTQTNLVDDGRASVVQIAVGNEHTLTLRDDGTLWAWGDNANGQLGLGDTDSRAIPTLVSDIGVSGDEWISVATGENHTLAIRDDGTLWAWGWNGNGRLGLGDTTQRLVPTAVSTAGVSGDDWTAVSAGREHTLALRDDGTLWAWGSGANGQLGLGDTGSRQMPTLIADADISGDEWISISVGFNGLHSIAVRDDGALWAWGLNTSGQLGKGIAGAGQGIGTDNWVPWRIAASAQSDSGSDWTSTDAATVPVNNAINVSMTQDEITIRFDRPMRAEAGEIAVDRRASVDASAGVWSENYTVFTAPLTLIVGDALHTVTARGFVDSFLGWTGSNEVHEHTWTFTTEERIVPRDAVQIAASDTHTLAVQADGTLWAWGDNNFGQLGLGDTSARTVPTLVSDAGVSGDEWVAVSTGIAHTLALRDDGTLWAWGFGGVGRLGTGNNVQQLTPTAISVTGVSGDEWVAVSVGDAHTLAIRDDGTLWAWGNNDHGRLGLNDTAHRSVPTAVSTAGVSGDDWIAVSAGVNHTLAIRDDGTLWAWGNNNQGRLGVGLGDTTHRSVPTAVSTAGVSGDEWTSVSLGRDHTLAIRDDGTLWSWGNNGNGRLGVGDTLLRNVPTAVSATGVSGDEWVAVSAGNLHTLAIRDDGTLWAWGNNGLGQLGLGDAAQRLAPVLVPDAGISGSAWNALSIGAGASHTVALRNDGALWSWGNNANGQLGKGIAGAGQGTNTDNWVPWRIAASLQSVSGSDWTVADDATAPYNTEVDVFIGTDVVTVRFDRPMRTGIDFRGEIIIDNGASVDVSAGTWSENNTVFTAPLTLIEDDTLHEATVRGFIDSFTSRSKMNEMYPHEWEFTTGGVFEGEPITYDGSTCATCHFTENLRLEHQFVVSRGVATAQGIEYGCQQCHGVDFELQANKRNWYAHSPTKIDNRTYTAAEDGSGMRDIDTYGCLSCHGGAGDPIHGGADRMLNAHTAGASFNPAVDTGCSSCHGPIGSASGTGFGFGVMDLASAHADYWIAARDGRVLDESAVSAAMQGDTNPFGCGVCHARIDNESRLRPQIVTHLDAAIASDGVITCTTCHVAPVASDSASLINHIAQRELVASLESSFDRAPVQTSARARLSAIDFFEGLSTRTRAGLNLGTADGDRLEPEVFDPSVDTSDETTSAVAPEALNNENSCICVDVCGIECDSCVCEGGQACWCHGGSDCCDYCQPVDEQNRPGCCDEETPPTPCPCLTGGTCNCPADDCNCDPARCTCTTTRPQESDPVEDTPADTPARDTNASRGPATGDAVNWYLQIAVGAALIAALVAMALLKTRRAEQD